LLAPMSYTPLKAPEVADHYRAVAGATGLPLCIYNNPGTTQFSFPEDLIGQLAHSPAIAAIKMPHPADGDFAGELARLRAVTPEKFAIGYSGDWRSASFLLDGGAAWYSVIAGLLPAEAMLLTRAAQAKDVERTAQINSAFEPMWRLIKAHGGLRIMYDIANRLGLDVGEPPRPLQRVPAIAQALDAALDSIGRLGAAPVASRLK
jgi:4-hydroxy-tetrahydrodipicolinate synthase